MSDFLKDAIIFHKELNPLLWYDGDMRPDIRTALIRMADEFIDYLGVADLHILDITVSGSNAAYTYTPHSDIDLHLIAKIPEGKRDIYLELFDAKKNLYNLTHNQTVKGYDVEFYVQDSEASVSSMGIYSVKNNKWVSSPKRVKANIDDLSIISKVAAYSDRIKNCLNTNDFKIVKKTWDDVKDMRSAGLSEGGEFSPENLAFKILRTKGLLQKLFDRMINLRDRQLSVESVLDDARAPPANPTYEKYVEWKSIELCTYFQSIVAKRDDMSLTVSGKNMFFPDKVAFDHVMHNYTNTANYPKVMTDRNISSQQINELFDSHASIVIVRAKPDVFETTCSVAGSDIRCITTRSSTTNIWSIWFSISGIAIPEDDERVLASVLRSTQMFIEKYKPETIGASSEFVSKTTRTNMYMKMMAKFAPMGYHAGLTTFTLDNV